MRSGKDTERQSSCSFARSDRTEVGESGHISFQSSNRSSLVRCTLFPNPKRESQEMVKGDVTFLPSSLYLAMPSQTHPSKLESQLIQSSLAVCFEAKVFWVAQFKGRDLRDSSNKVKAKYFWSRNLAAAGCDVFLCNLAFVFF